MNNVKLAQTIAWIVNPAWTTKPVKFIAGGTNGRVYETNDGRLMKFVYGAAPQEYMALKKLQGTFVVPRFKMENGFVKALRPNISRHFRKLFPKAKENSKFITVFVMGKVGNSKPVTPPRVSEHFKRLFPAASNNSKTMTLHNYYKMYPSANKMNIQRRVLYLVTQMAQGGVSHGDFHSKNIMVRVSPTGRITGMWVIDFGRSHGLRIGTTERQALNQIPVSELYKTHSMFRPHTSQNVAVRSGSRANVNMMNVAYKLPLSPGWEKRIANMRTQAAINMRSYKSPVRRNGPRPKSLTASRNTIGAAPRTA